jgi:bifunctional DNA-binding transcriptional regulator/antitoxin component of YhaV-PrlF toxin-antitoxin module
MIKLVHTTSVMKVSRNGQVSIPAAARARWATDRVVVVDLGDHVVMRPAAAEPTAALEGKYAGRTSSDVLRRGERRAADERELRQR